MPYLKLLPGGFETLDNISRIKSLMLSPTDRVLRQKYFAHLFAAGLAGEALHLTDRVGIDAWILAALTSDRPGQNLAEKIQFAQSQACAAGELLFLFFRLKGLALDLGERFQSVDSFSSLKITVAKGLDVSDSWLQKTWDEFKPVAHLWAAAHVERILSPEKTDLFSKGNAVRFLATATCVERFAVTYKAARQHNPLIEVSKIVSVDGLVSDADLASIITVLGRCTPA